MGQSIKPAYKKPEPREKPIPLGQLLLDDEGWSLTNLIEGVVVTAQRNLPRIKSLRPKPTWRELHEKAPDWLLYAKRQKVGALWETVNHRGQLTGIEGNLYDKPIRLTRSQTTPYLYDVWRKS